MGRMRDFALEAYFSKWEFVARYNLTASDAESVGLDRLLALAEPDERAAFERLHLGYTETWGAPALRERIAATYETLAADQLLCLAGAGEGIYIASRVLLEPADHAVVTTPNYQSSETVPLSICEVTGVPLGWGSSRTGEPADWYLDVDRVRAALRPNTRLVSINFPNNPTGMLPDRDAFDALVELCRERGIWLFSDEVYRLIESDPVRRLPQVADVYERGISLGVLSKSYGLPGLRIGWLACADRQLLARCERYKHFLSICNSAPSEALAAIALGARETLLERNRRLVRANAEHVGRFFSRRPDLFEWREPHGGCVGFPRYLGSDGVESFARRLVEEAGVLLLPSSLYRSEVGPVPEDRFRIGLGRAFVPDALAAMAAWVDAQGGDTLSP